MSAPRRCIHCGHIEGAAYTADQCAVPPCEYPVEVNAEWSDGKCARCHDRLAYVGDLTERRDLCLVCFEDEDREQRIAKNPEAAALLGRVGPSGVDHDRPSNLHSDDPVEQKVFDIAEQVRLDWNRKMRGIARDLIAPSNPMRDDETMLDYMQRLKREKSA